MSSPVRISVKEIAIFERDIRLRIPFRFGMVTMREAPQMFVQVMVERQDGGSATGYSAEVLAPKWFDKNPDLSNDDNFEQLRQSVFKARNNYRSAGSATPFELFAGNYQDQMNVQEDQKLVASFGQAILDRALIDAVCRMNEISFYTAIGENVAGIAAHDIAPDIAQTEIEPFLASLKPSSVMEARHTVGLVDPLIENPDPVADGLPETLEEVAATYGNRYYKIKVGGLADEDISRLIVIAEILKQARPDYRVSLDGNEQYPDGDSFLGFFERLKSEPRLSGLVDRILYIEQPIARAEALSRDMTAVSAERPVVIDESDNGLDVFPRAMELGYRGVSSKSCKGFYKSLFNLLRCRKAGPDHFLTGEDLTMQSGLAVQQDLALVSLLGLAHVERNGHHYVNGFGETGRDEQIAFLKAHPDLYHESNGFVRLSLAEGQLGIASLDCVGFASAALPDVASMRPIG